MELKYIILTIIKILISVPTIVMIAQVQVDAAALMGGHYDNRSNVTAASNLTDAYEFKIDLSDGDSQEAKSNQTTNFGASSELPLIEEQRHPDNSEEIPDPSALVVPGYNLPESIFNKGKPFYLERDPVTGTIDFNSKSITPKLYDEYEYVEEEPNYDIHDKANINRKDGNIGSHKPSDINQLTPNFHDFLNLPVKYNPDKYVYPLISSSYANTKVQGNVNKIHNHKEYTVTTYKPNYNPTYYTTKNYFGTTKLVTTIRPTTLPARASTPTIFPTTKVENNLMNSPMNHPSFGNKHQKPSLPEKPTTKKTMSLFEQLFGDYDEDGTTTQQSTSTSLLTTPTTMKHEIYNGNKITNGHMAPPASQNILTGSNMAYEYEDEEYPTGVSDNVMVETKKRPLLIQVTTPKETTVPEEITSTTKRNSYQVSEVDFRDGIDVTELDDHEDTTKTDYSTTTSSIPNKKVTSLPIGENHVTHKQPIIVATQNLREQLANEKVEGAKPFSKVPSTSNIHIAPDQDTVSFVVGHHQNVESTSGGKYQGTSLKESPYDSNPFRPVYGVKPDTPNVQNNYNTIQEPVNQHINKEEVYYQKYPIEEKEMFITGDDRVTIQAGSSVTIQPIKNSEASLAIGDPINLIKTKPGQVVDDQLEINQETIQFPKGTGPKIIFPDDKPTTYSPHHGQPPVQPPPTHQLLPNRDILQLSSKPMLHQLPSDLTPPREQEPIPPHHAKPPKLDRIRPPWDPRPGHFHQGRPEYARPPRPPPTSNNEIYKRIDTLPNILPQFRPNMNPHHHHGHNHGHGPSPHMHHHHPQQQQPHHHRIVEHPHKNFARQPLLERPSNRPIGFFEKLHPPPAQAIPPSPPKSLQNIRKVPALENEIKMRQQQQQQQQHQQQQQQQQQRAEERIMNLNAGSASNKGVMQEPLFGFLSAPPKVVLPNRRNGIDDPEVETLQMIQAKLTDRKEEKRNATKTIIKANMNGKDTLEKPLYVVYPVNTPPVKLDAVSSNKKDAVVIGTRGELPLPPSKITNNQDSYPTAAAKIPQEFNFEQNDRHDSPILKPHPRPSNYPIKSDFPYPLERPDPSILNPPVPDTPNNGGNNLDGPSDGKLPDEPNFMFSNQWNTIEEENDARIVNGGKINTQGSNQISVTLKTYTEKPIAVAYTPTEPNRDKYSIPNYASLVIPEIRPDSNPDSEFTVGTIIHTHPQLDLATQNMAFIGQNQQLKRPQYIKDKIDGSLDEDDSTNRIVQHEFQAPFLASANLDNIESPSQGWAVLNRNKETKDDNASATTLLPLATTREFDIENFKPQLEGGFKPIYSYPEEDTNKEMQVNERQE